VLTAELHALRNIKSCALPKKALCVAVALAAWRAHSNNIFYEILMKISLVTLLPVLPFTQ
jgi:hypothetical protein